MLNISTKPWVTLTALGILLASFGAAHADAIDGEWCQEGGGRHFTIKGPEITTPGGALVTGNYTRHAFSYTTPEGDDPSGTEINMRLMNEFTVHLREGKDPAAAVQVWKRCQPIS